MACLADPVAARVGNSATRMPAEVCQALPGSCSASLDGWGAASPLLLPDRLLGLKGLL